MTHEPQTYSELQARLDEMDDREYCRSKRAIDPDKAVRAQATGVAFFHMALDRPGFPQVGGIV
jgi:hypothetical protein